MKIIITIIVVVVISILIILSYYGLFTDVEIKEIQTESLWLIYEKHIGDYKNTGEIMDRIYNNLKNNDSIAANRGFGLYYDNPQDVEKEKLRSIVGCILEDKYNNKIEDLKKKYTIKKFPASKSIVSQFPFKGKPSIFIGIFMVYPKLSDHIKNNNYSPVPVMEIYDIPNKKINYVASVNLDSKIFDAFLE